MKQNGQAEIRGFLESHTEELRRRQIEAYAAYWESATTGTPEAGRRFAETEAQLKKLYSNRAEAETVKRWLADADGLDPLLHRQLVLLDLQYTGNLLPSETIDDLSQRAADLEQVFTTFRANLDGERVSNNQILDILRGELDSQRRRAAWEASKQVAREVAEPLRELVRRRNAAARSLGYDNFYVMGLALQEQDETQLFDLLERFERQSEESFRRLRDDVDRRLAARFSVAPEDLRPWHWADPFAQEAPPVGEVDLDPLFADVDLVALATRFFEGIGIPVDDVIERSDLWERDGKSQHAFAIDIDREGDVRTLCNLRQDQHWTMVLLHELGHAVYDKFTPESLPWILRTPAHTLSTEAIAMFFGRLTRDPEWLAEVLGADLSEREKQDIRDQLRLSMLVSARWMLVMAHFERALYRDPDRADLDQLWWDLVERMQRVRRPDGREEPDWAAKIHLSGAPVYYHNYLLGEWMASQLARYIDATVRSGRGLAGNTAVGEFLRDRVFAHGAALDWNTLLVESTGEGLNPAYFVEQFVAQ